MYRDIWPSGRCRWHALQWARVRVRDEILESGVDRGAVSH